MCSLAKLEKAVPAGQRRKLYECVKAVQNGVRIHTPVRPIQFSENTQPAGFRPQGANTGFQAQPEPGGGHDPTPGADAAERPAMLRTAGPRSNPDPHRAARQRAWCSAPASTRPAAPSPAACPSLTLLRSRRLQF